MQYVRSTLEILYTNSSFPHTPDGIQFLHHCNPALENNNPTYFFNVPRKNFQDFV